jgi:hypothetical protein
MRGKKELKHCTINLVKVQLKLSAEISSSAHLARAN